MDRRSGGVAVLLKSHIAYSRPNQLEDASVDNDLSTVRQGGLTVVVTTSNDRPDDIKGLRKTTKTLPRCKTSVDKKFQNGTLLFSDLNARLA